MLVLLWSVNRIDFALRNLPPGATNGRWSARIVGGVPHEPHDLERIIQRNMNVVRVEVLSENRWNIFRFRSGHITYRDIHSVYDVKILDVFSGENFEIGDVRDVHQIQRMVGESRSHFRPTGFLRRTTNYDSRWVRIPINIGDDLILVLNYDDIGWRFMPLTLDTIWGVYRYKPQEARNDYVNWAFEPVNQHNNLILTEEDLWWLKERRELSVSND